MTVEVRYWAAIRAAAGCKEESVDLADAATVADLAERLIADHASPEFERILNGCSMLVDGRSVARTARSATLIHDGATIEFLPPFAGG